MHATGPLSYAAAAATPDATDAPDAPTMYRMPPASDARQCEDGGQVGDIGEANRIG